MVGPFIFSIFCFFVYFFSVASPQADSLILALSVNLFAFSTPVPAVIGLRLLSHLIGERPSSVENAAEHILAQITTRLHPPDGAPAPRDMRYRWWMLMVICDLFGSYGPTLQLARPQESLSCLAGAVRADSVTRCKVSLMYLTEATNSIS